MDYDRLISLAREHRPWQGAPALPGFDTRLLARARALRPPGQDPEAAAFLPLFARWLWRASLGLAPVAALLVLLLVLGQGAGFPGNAADLASALGFWLPGAAF